MYRFLWISWLVKCTPVKFERFLFTNALCYIFPWSVIIKCLLLSWPILTIVQFNSLPLVIIELVVSYTLIAAIKSTLLVLYTNFTTEFAGKTYHRYCQQVEYFFNRAGVYGLAGREQHWRQVAYTRRTLHYQIYRCII